MNKRVYLASTAGGGDTKRSIIANASKDVANPRPSQPIACIGGVLFVILLYVLISGVVLGHMVLAQIDAHTATALSAAGREILGTTGYLAIVVAALLATSSAINATFYSNGRLDHVIAKTGELSKELERTIRNEHSEGAIICAACALVVANFVPLAATATMGSAGFLLIFFFVNIASVRLAGKTGARAWVSGLAAFSTAGALFALCWKVAENPATRNYLWILAGMIAAAVLIEVAYRAATGRKISINQGRSV